MKKKLWSLFLIISIIVCFSCECKAEESKEDVLPKLESPLVELDMENFVASWETVPNANGYTVKISGASERIAQIAEGSKNSKTGKYEYQIEKTTISGNYTLVVIAKGDSVVYANSNPSAEIKFFYEQQERVLTELGIPEFFFNQTTNILSWNGIPNAINYALQIGQTDVSQQIVFNSSKSRYEYDASDLPSGEYMVSLSAIGDQITYSNSAVFLDTIEKK